MARSKYTKWIIWGFGVLFLFYEFFLRVFPGVMVNELMFAFQVDASELGNLSAYYFYAYAPMQIPVGLLMDRYGARNLLTIAAAICGLGSILFASSMHIGFAEMGRFGMGIGSSVAFVGMVYICSHWFSPGKLALLIGLGNSIGMLGAAAGEGPLALIVNELGWRATISMFGLIGIILAFVIFLFVKNQSDSEYKTKKEYKTLLKNLKIVCQNKYTWINAFGALCFYMATGAFAGLWADPFLMEMHGMSKQLAGFAVSMVFIGWIVGGPIFGHHSDRLGHRRPLLILLSLAGLLAISLLIYMPQLSTWMIFALLFLLGAFSSGQLLNFSVAIEINRIEAKGTAIAFTNFIIAIGSAVLQPLVGWFLDLFWTGKIEKGIRIYTDYEYRLAMTTFPIMFALGVIFFLFLRETKKIENGSSRIS